jgi:hypothetical protein
MSSSRPFYNKALAALQSAHDACFQAPGRDVLGMSSGAFSGANCALGIIDQLERENRNLRQRIIEIEQAVVASSDHISRRMQ